MSQQPAGLLRKQPGARLSHESRARRRPTATVLDDRIEIREHIPFEQHFDAHALLAFGAQLGHVQELQDRRRELALTCLTDRVLAWRLDAPELIVRGDGQAQRHWTVLLIQSRRTHPCIAAPRPGPPTRRPTLRAPRGLNTASGEYPNDSSC